MVECPSCGLWLKTVEQVHSCRPACKTHGYLVPCPMCRGEAEPGPTDVRLTDERIATALERIAAALERAYPEVDESPSTKAIEAMALAVDALQKELDTWDRERRGPK